MDDVKSSAAPTVASAPPVASGPLRATFIRYAPLGLLILATGVVLVVAKGLIVPVTAALVLGSMLGPIVDRADEAGVPPVLTTTALMLGAITLLYFVILLLTGPITEWIGRAAEVGPLLRERLRFVERPLAAMHELQNSLGALSPAEGGITVGVRQSPLPLIVGVLTPALTELLIFFGTLFFFLADRRMLKRRVVSTLEERESRLRALHVFTDVEKALRGYMSIVTLINAGLGLATAAVMWMLGVPNPFLWGGMAFVLNFIPYLGALITASILLIVGLFTFQTLGQSLLPPGLFILLGTIEGHFLTPGIISRHLTLRPFFVFIALAFWTWLWGPVGAFLAVPLLIVGIVLRQYSTEKDERPNLP